MARVFALVVLLLWALPTGAEPVTHARIERSLTQYTVQHDLGFVRTDTYDWSLLTQRALAARDRATYVFYPSKQTVELVEAWVDQPDGSRVLVPPASVFTRPTTMAAGVVGFTTSRTTTVLFPQLRIGSRTHVVWKLTQRVPSMFGFNTFKKGVKVSEHLPK